MTTLSRTCTGILDPDDHGRWLVRPWPVDATFGEVVRHFLPAYLYQLQGDTNTARQLAYFEGYQAALTAASTHQLSEPAGWQWRAGLLGSVGRCVEPLNVSPHCR